METTGKAVRRGQCGFGRRRQGGVQCALDRGRLRVQRHARRWEGRGWQVCTVGSARILLDGIRKRTGQCTVLQLWQRRARFSSSDQRREEARIFRSVCQGVRTSSAGAFQNVQWLELDLTDISYGRFYLSDI